MGWGYRPYVLRGGVIRPYVVRVWGYVVGGGGLCCERVGLCCERVASLVKGVGL